MRQKFGINPPHVSTSILREHVWACFQKHARFAEKYQGSFRGSRYEGAGNHLHPQVFRSGPLITFKTWPTLKTLRKPGEGSHQKNADSFLQCATFGPQQLIPPAPLGSHY